MKALVFAVDDNYVIPLKVLWHTIYQTDSLSSDYQVFILHEDSLGEASILQLKEFFGVYRVTPLFKDLSTFVPPKLPLKQSDHVSRATFYRLYIASILPADIDYAVYLDVDTIVVRSIRSIFTAEIGDMPIAAVDHLSLYDQLRLWGPDGGTYFNAGVLIVNLKQWRDQKVELKFEDIIRTHSHRIQWWDQDILNIAFQNRWARIPIWFNVNYTIYQAIGEPVALRNSHLIHYTTSRKPWNQQNPNSLEVLWHKSLADLSEYAAQGSLATDSILAPAIRRSLPKVFDNRDDMIKSFIEEDMVVAEIGVLEGAFSESMLSKAKLRLIYLVDLFEGFVGSGDQNGNHFKNVSMENAYDYLIQKYRESKNVTIFKGSSQAFFEGLEDNSLDLVYIDADHSYSGCKSDLNYAFSKVRQGGLIVGHDYSFNPLKTACVYSFGVKKAVDEFCESRGQRIIAKAMDGCVSYAIRLEK